MIDAISLIGSVFFKDILTKKLSPVIFQLSSNNVSFVFSKIAFVYKLLPKENLKS